jgi:hypothetical protein
MCLSKMSRVGELLVVAQVLAGLLRRSTPQQKGGHGYRVLCNDARATRGAVTVAYSPPPGQQYYPPYQPYQAYPPVRPTNGLAIAALVCGVAAFVTGITFIPAIICGHLARREIRRTGEQGNGMAIAGLVCGYVGGILSIVVVLVIGLLAARAASTVTNVQFLPAFSTRAAPVGSPALLVPAPALATPPTPAIDPVTSSAPLPSASSLGH